MDASANIFTRKWNIVSIACWAAGLLACLALAGSLASVRLDSKARPLNGPGIVAEISGEPAAGSLRVVARPFAASAEIPDSPFAALARPAAPSLASAMLAAHIKQERRAARDEILLREFEQSQEIVNVESAAVEAGLDRNGTRRPYAPRERLSAGPSHLGSTDGQTASASLGQVSFWLRRAAPAKQARPETAAARSGRGGYDSQAPRNYYSIRNGYIPDEVRNPLHARLFSHPVVFPFAHPICNSSSLEPFVHTIVATCGVYSPSSRFAEAALFASFTTGKST